MRNIDIRRELNFKLNNLWPHYILTMSKNAMNATFQLRPNQILLCRKINKGKRLSFNI